MVRGLLSVYEPSGQYQLMVSELRPSGIGPLQLAFEQLKARLQAEGLFDEVRKRPLPQFPACVGVVTSPTGAAVRDIINVLQRRCPSVRIVLCPVKVQGDGAAVEIAAGIRAFSVWGGADVLIVGRGGGSAEDLWAFNEETVARAIYACPVPVISAVGHQTDFTIADFIADLRAPTPSAAAEFAVPVALELEAGLAALSRRLVRSGTDLTATAGQRLDEIERALAPVHLRARLRSYGERRDALAVRLRLAVLHRLESGRANWSLLREHLSALNPAAVLGRGYSVVRTPEGRIVRDAATVAEGEKLLVLLARGSLDCRVERVDTNGGGGLPGRIN
jgi:exodeoxyribonuclease VII large subunit